MPTRHRAVQAQARALLNTPSRRYGLLMSSDSFGYLTGDDDELHVDVVSDSGVERIASISAGEPCECACMSLLFDGVLYGPGTPAEVHQVMLRLPIGTELHLGKTYFLREREPYDECRTLAELEPHYAPPGLAIGDD
jgi:hypothetical protein